MGFTRRCSDRSQHLRQTRRSRAVSRRLWQLVAACYSLNGAAYQLLQPAEHDRDTVASFVSPFLTLPGRLTQTTDLAENHGPDAEIPLPAPDRAAIRKPSTRLWRLTRQSSRTGFGTGRRRFQIACRMRLGFVEADQLSGRRTRTGQSALRMTRCATLPAISRDSPVRPCVVSAIIALGR